jgi:tRNA A-37 threonylcarbamoyl transferase component Bud32
VAPNPDDEGEDTAAARYFARLADELSGQIVELDARISRFAHEASVRRAGFELLARLQRSLGQRTTVREILASAGNSIATSLRLDRTVMLVRAEGEEGLAPIQWLGYSPEENARLAVLRLRLPETVMSGQESLLVTQSTAETPLTAELRDALRLPYFIATAVATDQGALGVLIAGRLREVEPYHPALGAPDVDTLRAIAGFLAVVIRNLEKTDELRRQVRNRAQQLADVLAGLGRGDRVLPSYSTGDLVDGRYRVLRAIGAGGMGQVFEVERVSDGRCLALKLLRERGSTELLARFAREAQITAQLEHPHLVSIVDVDVTPEGVMFLVTELVRGASLDAAVAQYGDVPWAISMLLQVASGLAAIHALGIVHRDLKPANILVAGEGASAAAKIADFGIASLGSTGEIDDKARTIASHAPAANEAARAAGPAGGLTGTGIMLGTPAYMAPELAQGSRSAAPSSDIWSFGVIAHELLTGLLPFALPPLVAPNCAIELSWLTARAPVVPELRALVESCLARDPAARPTAEQLARELAAIAGATRA